MCVAQFENKGSSLTLLSFIIKIKYEIEIRSNRELPAGADAFPLCQPIYQPHEVINSQQSSSLMPIKAPFSQLPIPLNKSPNKLSSPFFHLHHLTYINPSIITCNQNPIFPFQRKKKLISKSKYASSPCMPPPPLHHRRRRCRQRPGGDRVRRLIRRRRQQQPDIHRAQEQLPALRPRFLRREADREILQRPHSAGFHRGGARPPPLRAGVLGSAV